MSWVILSFYILAAVIVAVFSSFIFLFLDRNFGEIKRNQIFWRSYIMANFDALNAKLNELDTAVAAVDAKIDELLIDADQTSVDAVTARVTTAVDGLNAAIAQTPPAPEPPPA